MPDLSMIIVVPKNLLNEQQIGNAIETVKLAYKVLETTIDIHYEIKVVEGYDGDVYYDSQFNTLYDHVGVGEGRERLNRAAAIIAGQNPRKKYVIFLCRQILTRDPITKALKPDGSNGFTFTGDAASIIAVQAPKSTVGNADGRTWAHEIGHGLGLTHTDPNNPGNLMHPQRHDDGGAATGFELTTSQKWTMVNTCTKLATQGI